MSSPSWMRFTVGCRANRSRGRSPRPRSVPLGRSSLMANGIGLVLVFVGWWEASGLGAAHNQLAWLNLSLLGLVAAGGANGLWLARGRRVVTLARAVVLPYPPGAESWPPTGPAASNGHAPGRTMPGRRRPLPAA